MTAIVNELRPGLTWLLLVAAGVLLSGAALMLVVLPSNHRFANQSSRQTSDAHWVRCPAPFVRAFDDIGSPAGWFERSPEVPAIVGTDAYCTVSARRRLSFALVLGGAGAAAVVVGRRRAGSSAA